MANACKEAPMATVLTLLGLCLALTVATSVLLSSLVREVETSQKPRLEAPRAIGKPQFFDASVSHPRPVLHATVPLDLLLSQIAQHVRLEQAAAEAFHRYPTVESLHRDTASPLMH